MVLVPRCSICNAFYDYNGSITCNECKKPRLMKIEFNNIEEHIPEFSPVQHLCLMLAMKRQHYQQAKEAKTLIDKRYQMKLHRAYNTIAKQLEREVGGLWAFPSKIGIIY